MLIDLSMLTRQITGVVTMETIGYEVWAFTGAVDAHGNECRTRVMKTNELAFADAQSEYERLENNEFRPKIYKVVTDVVDITENVKARLEAHYKRFANKD